MSTMKTLPARHLAARDEVAELTIDEVVRTSSAFKTLDELVLDAMMTGYRPSCYTVPMGIAKHHYVRAEKARRLADAFDTAMYERGLRLRAFRANENSPSSLSRFERV